MHARCLHKAAKLLFPHKKNLPTCVFSMNTQDASALPNSQLHLALLGEEVMQNIKCPCMFFYDTIR